MIEKGKEEKKLKKTEVPDLFHWRYIDEVPEHEYQLAIYRVTNSIQTIESNISTALVETIFSNHDAAFDIEGFLDYQYDCCNGESKKFLDTLGSLIEFGLSPWNKSGIVPSTSKGKRVDMWVAEKRNGLNGELNPVEFSNKTAHKILLLHELGILDYLTEKYFSAKQTIRTNTDLAKLISSIISDPNPDTVRKCITGINSDGKNSITTKQGIREVKRYLAAFDINLQTLKDPD